VTRCVPLRAVKKTQKVVIWGRVGKQALEGFEALRRADEQTITEDRTGSGAGAGADLPGLAASSTRWTRRGGWPEEAETRRLGVGHGDIVPSTCRVLGAEQAMWAGGGLCSGRVRLCQDNEARLDKHPLAGGPLAGQSARADGRGGPTGCLGWRTRKQRRRWAVEEVTRAVQRECHDGWLWASCAMLVLSVVPRRPALLLAPIVGGFTSQHTGTCPVAAAAATIISIIIIVVVVVVLVILLEINLGLHPLPWA